MLCVPKRELTNIILKKENPVITPLSCQYGSSRSVYVYSTTVDRHTVNCGHLAQRYITLNAHPLRKPSLLATTPRP